MKFKYQKHYSKQKSKRNRFLLVNLILTCLFIILIFLLIKSFIIFYFYLHNVDLAFNFLKDDTKENMTLDCYKIENGDCKYILMRNLYVHSLGSIFNFPFLFFVI